MIRCYFRFGCRNGAQNARLANARITDEADISENLQFQLEPAFFPRFAFFGKGRSPVGTGTEVVVAAAATAAFGNDSRLAIFVEIRHEGARRFFAYERTYRYGNDQIIGIAAEFIAPLAFATGLSLEEPAVAEVDEGIDVAVGYEDDIAALAAVTAVRSPLGYELFVAEAAHAVATAAGLYKYSCSVYKHGSPHDKKRNQRSLGRSFKKRNTKRDTVI